MADNKVEVVIGANIAGLVRGMSEAGASVRSGVDTMKSHFSGISSMVAGFGAAFAGMAAILGGGKVFKESIDATVNWTVENSKLARTLGITTEDASILNVALGDVLASTEQYVRGVQMMTRQINAGGKGFKELGIDVRDSQGHLRNSTDIMTDSIAKLNGLKAGTDRNVAASKLFGRAWMEILPVLKLTNESMEEAKVKAEKLGLVVGPEQAAKVRAYRIAMHEVHEVFEAIKIQIGNAVLPVLLQLGQFFEHSGPAFVEVFKYAIRAVIEVFLVLRNELQQNVAEMKAWYQSVQIYFGSIPAQAEALKAIFGGLGDAMNSALHGDFSGARAALAAVTDGATAGSRIMTDAGKLVELVWQGAFQNMNEAQRKFVADTKALWNPKAAKKSEAPEGGTLPQAAEPDKAFLAAMKEQGEYEIRVAEEVRDAKIAALKAVEDAAGADDEARRNAALNLAMLAITSYGEGSVEAIRAMQHVAEVERGIKERRKSDALSLAQARGEYELQVLDIQADQARQLLELGAISGQQEIEQLRRIEDEKYQVRRRGIEMQLADQQLTVTQRALLNQQLESLELAHDATMDEIEIEALARLKERTDAFVTNWTSTWGAGVEAMLNGTMSLAEGVKGVFTTLRGAIARTIGQMVQDWMTSHLKMYVFFVAQKIRQLMVQQTTDKAAAASTAATAMSEVGSKGAVAAAGAASSAASIPYVGWAIAIGAAVAVLASVLAFRSNISAAGGFDIPGGLNPVTQLHQKEMVLPAPLADRVRKMTAPERGTTHAPVTNITNVFNVTAANATAAGLRELRSTVESTIAPAAAGRTGTLASAAGGWDLGSGTPPIAQLHEKEMVLPRPLAERVRDMTETRSESSSTSTMREVVSTVKMLGSVGKSVTNLSSVLSPATIGQGISLAVSGGRGGDATARGGPGGTGGRGGFGIGSAAVSAMQTLRESVSAAGGWDIGASMPAVAQLHPREMVLPAPLADSVRAMTGEAPSLGDVHLHMTVHAVDAKSVERLFRDNDGSLFKVITEGIRNGRAPKLG